ncbi:MAG: hypothetical protein AVDCRST_MAG33-3186, partial [uncultured Thermomicrobiales bacterium]
WTRSSSAPTSHSSKSTTETGRPRGPSTTGRSAAGTGFGPASRTPPSSRTDERLPTTPPWC